MGTPRASALRMSSSSYTGVALAGAGSGGRTGQHGGLRQRRERPSSLAVGNTNLVDDSAPAAIRTSGIYITSRRQSSLPDDGCISWSPVMAERKIGSAIVVEGEKVVGLFTTVDALARSSLSSRVASAPRRRPRSGSHGTTCSDPEAPHDDAGAQRDRAVIEVRSSQDALFARGGRATSRAWLPCTRSRGRTSAREEGPIRSSNAPMDCMAS